MPDHPQNLATELVFGLVGPIGADREKAFQLFKDGLLQYGYVTKQIKISQTIKEVLDVKWKAGDEHDRLSKLMDAGNSLRKRTGKNEILGQISAQAIRDDHNKNGWDGSHRRFAYVIDSLKHPREIQALRQIYPNGFIAVALFVDPQRREEYLTKQKGVTVEQATELLKRDESEDGHGQSTRRTFQLADYFLHYDGNEDKLRNSIARLLRLVFGNPFSPPTFNEFAMYAAYASAMRSLDLSRQVGAVVAQDNCIIGTGANDAPRFGGGQYWPQYNPQARDVEEVEGGRDYTIQQDANHREKEKILDEMVAAIRGGEEQRKQLRATSFKDITEFGRATHAEMEALLSCARLGHSTKGADVYSTTFPCHNCAKHLVAAGIRRVYYIEPYPKSRALDLHPDALSMRREDLDKKLVFRPFVGVGPRQYMNFFSLRLGEGREIDRKCEETGRPLAWEPKAAIPRVAMVPMSYKELEDSAAGAASRAIKQLQEEENGKANGE